MYEVKVLPANHLHSAHNQGPKFQVIVTYMGKTIRWCPLALSEKRANKLALRWIEEYAEKGLMD